MVTSVTNKPLTNWDCLHLFCPVIFLEDFLKEPLYHVDLCTNSLNRCRRIYLDIDGNNPWAISKKMSINDMVSFLWKQGSSKMSFPFWWYRLVPNLEVWLIKWFVFFLSSMSSFIEVCKLTCWVSIVLQKVHALAVMNEAFHGKFLGETWSSFTHACVHACASWILPSSIHTAPHFSP